MKYDMKTSTRLMSLIVGIMIIGSISPNITNGWRVSASATVNEIEYTNHAPIRVNNNAELLALAVSDSNVNGSGTSIDPITIEDLKISSLSAGTGLYIGNISLNFVVRNNSISFIAGNGNEYYWNSGIVLHNATNGIIEYNKIYNNTNHGICVDLSTRLTLKWNQIYNNTANGIHLFTSTEITMANNTIHHNILNGISIVNGFTDDFNTDTRYWYYYGSAHRNASRLDAELTNNTFQAGAMWLKPPVFVPMTIDYIFFIAGGDGGDGMVTIFNKDRNYVPRYGRTLGFSASLTDSVPGYGIEFDEYSNIPWDPTNNAHVALVTGNTSNHVYYSDDSRIGGSGWHTVKMKVWDSRVKLKIDSTPPPEYAIPVTIDRTYGGFGFSGSTGGYWNYHVLDDITVQFNETNLIRDNTIHNNSANGIHLERGNHDIVLNNTVRYNDIGIALWMDSTKVSIIKNNVSYNNHAGISIDSSNGNTLKDNNVSYNNQDVSEQYSHAGVKFLLSDNNTMEHNYVSYNPYFSVHFQESTNNILTNNQIVFNCGSSPSWDTGLMIYLSNYNRFEWNNISKGTGRGMWLLSSNNNYFGNNTVNDNTLAGGLLGTSSYNIIENSSYLRNGDDGLTIYSNSDSNIIRYNNISGNAVYGLQLGSSTKNRIHHNLFINNGIATQASDDKVGNYWNASDKGNYWSNYHTDAQLCYDTSPSDGICDDAYPIPGGGSAFDYRAIRQPQVPDTIDTSMFILAITLISSAFVAARKRR